MKASKTAFVLFLAILFAGQSFAQDSLAIRDALEIRNKAQSLVKKEYNELLNSLSNTAFETLEIEEIRTTSYSGTRNRIFWDSLVLVEDDINPSYKGPAQARDETLDKYLKDLDLLYKKTDSSTIDFQNVRCSDIKKKNNIYVKVYFNSLFKGKNTVGDTIYTTTNRVAEIRADKDRNQWKLYIVRVGFFDPADTVNDLVNDIPIKHEISQQILASSSSPADSATAAVRQQTFDEELEARLNKEQQEKDRYDDAQFKRLLAEGDKSKGQNDFTNAMNFYKQAGEIHPYDVGLRRRLRQTKDAMDNFTIRSSELYERYITKARLDENNRQYEDAISDYQNALKQKPEDASKYEAHIHELNEKFRTLSELDDKYKAGLYKEAIKEYSDAIKKDGKNSDYYLGRGKCYEKTGDPVSNAKPLGLAQKDYNTAYALDNNNLQALKCGAELYTRTGDYFKALTNYKTYLTIDKDNIDIYERKSELHLLLNLNTDALADLDQALVIDPKASHVYLSKGLLLLQKRDYKAANENFTNTIQIDTTNALAYYNRGKCQLTFNNVANAASDFENARNKGIDGNDDKNIMAFASDFYTRASAKFGAGKKDSAIVLIDYAIAVDPLTSLYRFTRGEYYFSLANYKEAIVSYDQAIRLNDKYNEALYKRGLAYYNSKNYPAAIENFKGTLALNPNDVMAQKGAGDSYFALHDYASSADNYETCLKTAGNLKNSLSTTTLAEIYNTLGKSYFEQSNFEKALADFKNAVKNDRNFAEAYFNKGHTYFSTNDLSDAIEDIVKALSLGEKHYQWHYVLAMAYQAKNDYGNAATYYSNCIRLDTLLRQPDAVCKAGFCRYRLLDYPAALTAYSRCRFLQLDTANATFNIELGAIYLNTGKYDSAYASYAVAYAKDSTNGFASYGMASAVLLQGKTDESLTWFEKSFQVKALSSGDIKRDKLIANIRSNKKFKDLMKKYY